MTKRERNPCDGIGHAWTIKNSRGHDEVYCARCMRCLGVDTMLAAYVSVHGGTVTRG